MLKISIVIEIDYVFYYSGTICISLAVVSYRISLITSKIYSILPKNCERTSLSRVNNRINYNIFSK